MLKDQREPEGQETGEGQEARLPPPPPPAGGIAPCGRGCSVPGCGGHYLARGYCIRHYYQVKRHGAVREDGEARSPCRPHAHTAKPWVPNNLPGRRQPMMSMSRRDERCAEERCDDLPFARGLCRLHYIMARSQDLVS